MAGEINTLGKHVSVEIIVTGQGGLQGGSFRDVQDWELTPDAEIMKKGFSGRTLKKAQLDHNGYDFKFSTLKRDAKAQRIYMALVTAYKNFTAPPDITVVVTERYLTSPATSSTFVLKGVTMKMDSTGHGDAKDFEKTQWSGFAEDMSEL